MNQEVRQTYEGMRDNLLRDLGDEADDIWQEAQTILEPVLLDWARAAYLLKTGNSGQKKIAKQIINSAARSVRDVKDAYMTTAVNYLWNKLAENLLMVLTRHLLPALVAAI